MPSILDCAVVLLCSCSDSRGAAANENPRIGYLGLCLPSANPARIEAFRQGLRELGYVEGKTLSLSGDMRRENSIASPRLRPS